MPEIKRTIRLTIESHDPDRPTSELIADIEATRQELAGALVPEAEKADVEISREQAFAVDPTTQILVIGVILHVGEKFVDAIVDQLAERAIHYIEKRFTDLTVRHETESKDAGE
jgi:hypothetical protein